jgi:hypothetical protein
MTSSAVRERSDIGGELAVLDASTSPWTFTTTTERPNGNGRSARTDLAPAEQRGLRRKFWYGYGSAHDGSVDRLVRLLTITPETM